MVCRATKGDLHGSWMNATNYRAMGDAPPTMPCLSASDYFWLTPLETLELPEVVRSPARSCLAVPSPSRGTVSTAARYLMILQASILNQMFA